MAKMRKDMEEDHRISELNMENSKRNMQSSYIELSEKGTIKRLIW